jgi:hypothetical protein
MGDAFHGFVFGQKPHSLAGCGDTEPPTCLVRVRLDSAFANIEELRHFLGLQMFGDQPEYLPLTLRQRFHGCQFHIQLCCPRLYR